MLELDKTGIKQVVLDELISIAERYHIEKLILFGSRARGDFRRTSDIDLAGFRRRLYPVCS